MYKNTSELNTISTDIHQKCYEHSTHEQCAIGVHVPGRYTQPCWQTEKKNKQKTMNCLSHHEMAEREKQQQQQQPKAIGR